MTVRPERMQSVMVQPGAHEALLCQTETRVQCRDARSVGRCFSDPQAGQRETSRDAESTAGLAVQMQHGGSGLLHESGIVQCRIVGGAITQ